MVTRVFLGFKIGMNYFCFWEKSLFLIEQGFFICVKIENNICIIKNMPYICNTLNI